ncbi:MAG: hypothetical protein ACE5HX_19475 [bacterium]
MVKFRLTIFGVALGVLLGAVSHLFEVSLLSGTDILIHLILAAIGGTVGFIVDNK